MEHCARLKSPRVFAMEKQGRDRGMLANKRPLTVLFSWDHSSEDGHGEEEIHAVPRQIATTKDLVIVIS